MRTAVAVVSMLLAASTPAAAQAIIGRMTSAQCRALGGMPESSITSRSDPDPIRNCYGRAGRGTANSNAGGQRAGKAASPGGTFRNNTSTYSAPYSSGNRAAARVAAGVALGGALFSIIESLASQSKMTDDVSSMVNQIQQQHKNRSVEYNRRGLALQQAGRFKEARLAFLKAADEAVRSGDGGAEDSIANNRNAAIADALHWLRQGYEDEKAGKKNKANISYQMGLQAARQAGVKDIESQLERANDKLSSNNPGKNFNSDAICGLINGKMACNQ